ncbi:MAG: TlpA family protein disulfide reductase [Phycisphaerales bacterium]|nr:MAG: TlpA family protein disulfide reductase [Phycisphaerales bacterium]
MAVEIKSRLCNVVVCVSIPLLVLGGLTGCGKEESPPQDANAAAVVPAAGTEQASVDPMDAATALFREPTPDLQHIVSAAKTWSPSFQDWWGKTAPDFTLNDINGNPHALSTYRGKNVVVAIWTTWIATCRLQTPHLKELRNAYQDADVAVLAISNESPALLKEAVEEQGINFTVLSGGANLPAPFGEVEYAPASFFIDPQGRFKLISSGLVPASDAKAIVQAR